MKGKLFMNKQELYRATKEIVSQELEGVTLKDTGVFVDAVVKAIQNALIAGDKISLIGFGSFETVERPERMGRNPKTNEQMLIKSSKAIKFKAGKALKDVVNGVTE